MSFTLHNVNFTLINCYVPSGNTSSQTIKRVKAIQSIISFLNNLDFRKRQLASDFNLLLKSIDRTGYFAPNTNDKILFQKLISNLDLTDSYRYFYPYTKIFSFSRSRPTSSLDRIYLSSSLIPKISNTSYYSIPFSDHNKAPIITVKIPNTTIFKSSHWKLNDSIISFPHINFFIESIIKIPFFPSQPHSTTPEMVKLFQN